MPIFLGYRQRQLSLLMRIGEPHESVGYPYEMRQALLAVALSSVANASPPAHCEASVRLPDNSVEKAITAKGVVKSVTHRSGTFPHYAIVFTDDAQKDHAFDLYITTVPFKVKATIDVTLRRGAAFQIIYDALIKDGAGKTLIVASDSGAVDLADGWSVKQGVVIESHQDPNQKQQSVDRTTALDFERGKTKATVKPRACVEVKDGDDTYLISGFGHSWLGVRPPEGVDYQMFSIIRQPH